MFADVKAEAGKVSINLIPTATVETQVRTLHAVAGGTSKTHPDQRTLPRMNAPSLTRARRVEGASGLSLGARGASRMPQACASRTAGRSPMPHAPLQHVRDPELRLDTAAVFVGTRGLEREVRPVDHGARSIINKRSISTTTADEILQLAAKLSITGAKHLSLHFGNYSFDTEGKAGALRRARRW